MPFYYTDVQIGGQYVCCPSWCPTNFRVDSNNNPIGFKQIYEEEDVKRNWESEMANDIRKSVYDGTYRHCDKKICPSLSMLLGGEGKPYNFLHKKDFEKAYNIKSIEDIDNFKNSPKEILFGFDRSCNLKCPSCRTKLIPNDDIDSIEHKQKLHLLNSIETNYANTLEKICITGSGDPFYSKIFRDYLINFKKEKYPNLKGIQIITNGNLLDEKMWSTLKAAPYIKIVEVSIDAATKETYETKTRLNGQWDKLIDNLKFLSKIDSIEEFVCSMVVSKHNYKEMFLFYELITDIFKNSNFKWGISINYRQLVDWGTYSKETLTELQVFKEEHELFFDFIEELKKIHNKQYVNHNFHHLIN
jgi:MoaA/NifB/PqqE/SkfB family radical SAM enzyme